MFDKYFNQWLIKLYMIFALINQNFKSHNRGIYYSIATHISKHFLRIEHIGHLCYRSCTDCCVIVSFTEAKKANQRDYRSK